MLRISLGRRKGKIEVHAKVKRTGDKYKYVRKNMEVSRCISND